MEKYHFELLKRISNIYNLDYNDLVNKVPYNNILSYQEFLKSYMTKSLKELHKIAIDNGCSKSGKKENIIERIYNVINKKHSNNTNINSIPISNTTDNINVTSNITDNNNTNNNTNNNIINKVDICIGTDDNKSNDNIEEEKLEINAIEKCINVSDRDIILLLQTHNLSIDGTRVDLINRLKEFYNKAHIKNNKVDEINDYILGIDDNEYVSRHEMNTNLLNIISTGIPIKLLKDNKWNKIDNNFEQTNYIIVPNKNWIFKETEFSYEFIGIAQMDNTYVESELPKELLE
jgi:hypothetical protein